MNRVAGQVPEALKEPIEKYEFIIYYQANFKSGQIFRLVRKLLHYSQDCTVLISNPLKAPPR